MRVSTSMEVGHSLAYSAVAQSPHQYRKDHHPVGAAGLPSISVYRCPEVMRLFVGAL